MDAAELLQGNTVVPVIEIDDAAASVELAETLLAAGLSAIEITLRTEAGLPAIEAIAGKVPGMLVGAGSVRRPDQFRTVKNAGAKFAVCPGSSPVLLDAADDARIPFIPGAVTASEMLNLLANGYALQKFFPAELAGGAKFLKAIGGPIPEVRFMPTGGIGPGNAREYLALKNVSCLGGSWIAPRDLLQSGDFAEIRQRAAAAAKLRPAT